MIEFSGDNGKIVVEDDKLTFWRNRISESKFNAEFTGGFGSPECWKCEIPIIGDNSQHVGIMKNWIDAILKGTKLIAPGIEGINGLTIFNAMYLSAWTDNWVELPMDEELYYEILKEKISLSPYKKEVSQAKTIE